MKNALIGVGSKARRYISKIANGPAPKTPPAKVPPPAPNPFKNKNELRKAVGRGYLKGRGIEIGALHKPYPTHENITVQYVDRMDVEGLRKHYPELNHLPLVPIDIVTDGEKLSAVADASQDFVIASHFLEHCEDPIGTVKTLFRVLKTGGALLLIVPDKRHTFDVNRAITTFDHLLADHKQGPEGTRESHYEEWARFVKKLDSKEAIAAYIETKMKMRYSIHFHVWDSSAFFDFIGELRTLLENTFQVDFFAQNEDEIVCVLRKR
jgi:predicted SAM-dependent methyltransferase